MWYRPISNFTIGLQNVSFFLNVIPEYYLLAFGNSESLYLSMSEYYFLILKDRFFYLCIWCCAIYFSIILELINPFKFEIITFSINSVFNLLRFLGVMSAQTKFFFKPVMITEITTMKLLFFFTWHVTMLSNSAEN